MSALRRLPHCLRDLPCACGLALTLLRTGDRRNGGRLRAPLVSGDPLTVASGASPLFLAARNKSPLVEPIDTNSPFKRGTMPTRNAEAEWKGNLVEGSGRLKVGSGAFDGPYSFKSRFEEGQSATNPEELLGAAHAGCFTMALTSQLSRARITPRRIHTDAKVTLEKVGEHFSITRIELETRADIPGIDNATFQKYALDAKQNCPVSKALAATEIHLNATLETLR